MKPIDPNDHLKKLIASSYDPDIDEMEGEIIGTIAVLFRDLLIQNWMQIQAIRKRSEDSAVAVSFGFDVDTSGKQPLVKGKIAYSEKFKDEAECWVQDPQQQRLQMDN
jgi:hypothetical protein